MTRPKNSKKIELTLILLVIVCIVVFAVVIVFTNDSDEYSGEQWYLYGHSSSKSIQKGGSYNAETIAGIKDVRAGTKSEKGADTVVAVIDTLVDWSHEDLKGKVWTNSNETPNDGKDNDNNSYIDDYYGYNFLEDKGISFLKTKNPGAHGTAITGVICANMNNGVGIAGITGEANVKVMNLAVLDSITTEGGVSNLIEAILYAEKNGAKICNISANYLEANNELLDVIQQSKMFFVVSAGNRPTLGLSIDEVVNIPAMYNFNNVVTVSALTQEFCIMRQANYGVKTVDILAPGDEIIAPIPNEQYAYFSGTSIATPIVTGLAALLDQNSKEISASDLKKHILSLASHNDDYGFKIKDGAYLQLSELLIN